jgi:prepilin-type N-terminal cleavage/methylation domain-containing protein
MYLKNKKGITLVELLAVLIIIGIIAGIALTLSSGTIHRMRIRADLANIETLNQSTYLYVTIEDIPAPYFEPSDSDEERIRLLYDQGYINKIVTAQAKGASIYWSVEDECWLYSLNAVAADVTEEYIFEDLDTSDFVQSGSWVDNPTNLYSTYGLLFIENPRSEYQISVSAKLNSGTSGGLGIFFETTLAPDNKDSGFILQLDRGYVSGTVLIRPRTNGAEGSPISTHKFNYTNSFIPDKNLPEGALWWASTHEITLRVDIDPNTPFTKILSVWIDDQLVFDDFIFQSSISPTQNFTGLRTWSLGVEFYHVLVESID